MDDNDVRNTPKRQRNSEQLGMVDRISALPNFILGNILSFLPRKDAVDTSILSTRWKYAWVAVGDLRFYRNSIPKNPDDMKMIENDNMKFIEYVYRILLVHDVGSLNKFSLSWFSTPHILQPHVSSWINTAIARNLQVLYLNIMLPVPRMFQVPTSVFSCVSLRCMQLNKSCSISLSDSFEVCLPRLTKLKLLGVEFQSEEAFEKLIKGCPMLNELDVLLYSCDFRYIISSTSLRRLILHCVYAYSLWLFAPKLHYLKLGGSCVPIDFELASLSSGVEVDFAISPFQFELDRDSIVEAVSVFDCAYALTLSAEAMLALSHGTIQLTNKFSNLVKLKTDIRYCDWRSLQDLIQRSDNLRVLKIHQDLSSEIMDRCRRFKWTTPGEVPNCLSKSLKKVVFDGYDGDVDDELELIQYMLTHGSVLEAMRIICVGEMNSSKLKSIQEIGKYQMKSPCCVVKFIGWTSSNNIEVCFTARLST